MDSSVAPATTGARPAAHAVDHVSDDDDEEEAALIPAFCAEPAEFYRARLPARTETHRGIRVRTTGEHSLWTHYLWNGGRALADAILDSDARSRNDDDDGDGGSAPTSLVRGKCVCELGAGACLPAVAAARCGARCVVATDFPDRDIMEAVRENMARCRRGADAADETAAGAAVVAAPTAAVPHRWGDDVSVVLAQRRRLCERGVSSPTAVATAVEGDSGDEDGFDVVIMADLVSNHHVQHKLLASLTRLLHRERGVGLLAFGHHRPHMAHKDLAFIDMACRRAGLVAEHWKTVRMAPMFADDPGDALVRGQVHMYTLRWAADACRR